jgi:protein-S-isoprenylcysteine O-methyltransferase Ste14
VPDRALDAVLALLARRRIPLGFLSAAAAIALARPTWLSWTAGLVIAAVGEGLRIWASGHIEKDREVTMSGPYQRMRHPLYVGSSVMALGAVIASLSVVVTVLVALYMTATIGAAVLTEEARLRQTFGTTYDDYARATAPAAHRSFSLERAMRNREYRAAAGLLGGFLLLALKTAFNL